MVKYKAQKKAIIAVTNDLVGDYRVHKTAMFLKKNNVDVLLVGRKLKNSNPVEETNYATKRFSLLFNKGLLFYAAFNIRLFFFLIFRRFDIIVANDLDTLIACFAASLCTPKGLTKLVYDSHEYFTEVPELVHRPLVKRVWLALERVMLPHLRQSITVCQSIADIYHTKYGLTMQVVRNIPNKKMENVPEIILPYKENIIIYQGALNIGRGIEIVIEAMQYIENVRFMIVGDGDIADFLKHEALRLGVEHKVVFCGKIPHSRLLAYTLKAKLGISLEQNIGLNYYYALPNKLFDYIHAHIPILASNLPEISRIVNHYNIGLITSDFSPLSIAHLIEKMLTDSEQRSLWLQNLALAAHELNWADEENKLKKVFENWV